MQEVTDRIGEALRNEEVRAEQFANDVRLVFLTLLSIIALLNSFSVTYEANVLNFGALMVGYTYGIIVFVRMRRSHYHRVMKYITSCLDIVLVYLLLYLYSRLDVPSVALKNYVFLVIFPMIALTAFRYNRSLTLVTGGLAVALYFVLTLYLSLTGSVGFVNGGYERELFSADVTYIGQSTKILILAGFVLLMSHLAQYSRRLFVKLVSDELTVRNEKELTDLELNIASQVQSQFLPGRLPEIRGLELYGSVQQGKFVGGDYYDFIKLSDDTLLVVIADVSGNGVPAALIMAEVRASTHVLASTHIDLEALARQINLLIHQSTDKKSFVTFCAAEVNTRSRLVRYVNAGHPPPLIYVNGKIHSLAKGTIPLGVCASLPMLTTHVEEFPPGSILISYTDGLLEQTDSHEEQFGEGRVQDFVRANVHLNAQSITQTLLSEIKSFALGQELTDDVGLAVVKYLASSPA